MKIIVGTRESKLALAQTYAVIEKIKAYHEGYSFEIKTIKTKGDKIQDVALDKIGDKGIFVKEIEMALLQGEIDLAIHSMKDMPSEVTKGLSFACTPLREDPRDALVLKAPIKSLDELPRGAVIGTGSKRRSYQLLKQRPDLKIVPIRGNIDTRIKKIEQEGLDGIVLATAGLRRLGLEDQISYYLSVEEMIPAPAQGALGLQLRAEDIKLKEVLQKIAHMPSQMSIEAERAFLKAAGGSCNIPIGAYAHIEGEYISLSALLGDEKGDKVVTESIRTTFKTTKDLIQVGESLAKKIVKELN